MTRLVWPVFNNPQVGEAREGECLNSEVIYRSWTGKGNFHATEGNLIYCRPPRPAPPIMFLALYSSLLVFCARKEVHT